MGPISGFCSSGGNGFNDVKAITSHATNIILALGKADLVILEDQMIYFAI